MKKDTTADIWFENAPGSFFLKTRSVSGSCNGTHHRFHGEKKA